MKRRLTTRIPRRVKAWLRILASYTVSLPLVAGALALLLMLLQSNTASDRISQVTELLAGQQAETVATSLEQLSQRVGAVAALESLQLSTDTAQTERGLAQKFDGASAVYLVPLGPLGIADRNNPALDAVQSHVQRDMLRRASDSDGTVIDAHPGDNGKWQLSFAHRVPQVGALLVSYPASYLEQRLRQQRAEEAQSEVLVQYRNRSQVIAATAVPDPGEVSSTVKLPVSDWSVRTTPSQQLLNQFAERNTPLLLVSLVCIAVAVLNVIFSARSSRALNRALAQAENGVQDADEADILNAVFSAAPEVVARGDADGAATAEQEELEELAEIAELTGAVDEAERDGADSGAALDNAVPVALGEPAPQLAALSRDDLDAVPGSIYRAYDIRGLAEEQLSSETCYCIGRGLGSEVRERGHSEILLGRDGRHSSERIRDDLVRGLRESGVDVIDLGLIPTPVLHFASFHRDVACAVMITGSHCPAHYNGMKIVIDRQALSDDDIQALERRIDAGQFSSGDGDYRSDSVVDDYITHICGDILLSRRSRVVIDAGNGAASEIAPRLFRELGCRVEPLFCEVDGDFPNHAPDPSVESNLEALKAAVQDKRAQLGIAFDGDGDRVAVVTASGRMLAADQLLMVLARDIVSRNPGAQVLFDVKCSRHLNRVISDLGGIPVMWKSGHSFMKRKMRETGALLGGEFSGHIFFNERWFGFDDGLYAAARLLEVLGMYELKLDELLDALPRSISTPEILLPVDDARKFELVAQLSNNPAFSGGTISLLDGIRVDYADGWGLLRASNTGPALTLRFEADDQAALAHIQDNFRQALSSVDSELAVGF